MIADIYTIMWKEWKEIVLQRGNMRGGLIGLAILIAVFGIILPLQMGRPWLEQPQVLIYWLWVPLLLVSTVTADSFAGERERHTLETLLASRLPDRAILFGKVAAAIFYGWGVSVASVLLGVVTVNIANRGGGFVFYPAWMALAILLFSLLGSGLAANAGTLISLRAATVRQAQQIMSMAILALVLLPIFGLQALPQAWQQSLFALFSESNVIAIVLEGAAILLLLDAILLAVSMARFQRPRLILD
ncbi:MAG: ABC transporter permease [Anaerolineae bacterium]